MTMTRDELYRLIDDLPEDELPTAKRFLQFLHGIGGDPLVRALVEAPWDDEPETPDELTAVQLARGEMARGEVVTDAELWEGLGAEPRD